MTSGVDSLSLILGLCVGMTAVAIGYGMRRVSHSILPTRDPFFLANLIGQCTAAFLGCIAVSYETGFEWAEFFVSDLSLILMMAFDAGFLLGYAISRPGDTVYMDLPDGEMGSNTLPIVHYWNHGHHYMMPQTIGTICKSFLGVRYPLDADFNEIKNYRRVSQTNGLIKLSVTAVVASLHDMEEISIGKCRIGNKKIILEDGSVTKVQRYLFHFYAEIHVIHFGQTAVEDPERFWREAGIYIDAIEAAAEAKEYATRLEIQQNSIKYDAAANMVAGLIALTDDAPDAKAEIRLCMELQKELMESKGGDTDVQHTE